MRLLGQKTIYAGWGRFLLLDVRLGDGRTVQRQLEDHGDAAVVLPYDPQRRTALLVRQPRVGPLYRGLAPFLLEAAAGCIDPGESAETAAVREAFEELGVRLGRLEPVATAWSTPSASSERLHLYLAPYGPADRTGPGGGVADEGEEIEVLETPLAELAARADAGDLCDLKTLALLGALARRRPELFA